MIIPERTLKDHQREWASWYSGDPTRILNYYNTLAFQNSNAGRFWGNLDGQAYPNVVHMPLAQDICATSSALLFSESPDIRLQETKAQDRINAFHYNTQFESTLLEASDICAGLGGVFLKIDVNREISPFPIITTRQPLSAHPTFHGNRLYSVDFRRVIHEDDKKQVLLIETRTKSANGFTVNYTVEETKGNTIQQVVLEDAKTEYKIDVEDYEVKNVDGIGVVYVPNMLPNRLFPNSREGVPDYQGSMGLLDSLDEVWSSWIRDIELGMARLMVDSDALKSFQPNGASDNIKRFDPHQSAFLKMDLDAWKINGDAKPIEMIQFEIRYDAHAKSAKDLTESIISRSGYAPQSFGLNTEGRAESGTSLKIRERKSLVTRQKKARYWSFYLSDLLYQLQQIDNSHFQQNYTPERPSITLSDSISDDPKEISETVRNLQQAEAASTKVLVRMVHQDWTDDQIEEEVKTILSEKGVPLRDASDLI